MPKENEPMIKLEPGGKAPILSYNVPEPTSYTGRNLIEMQFPEEYFKPELRKKPPQAAERTHAKGQDLAAIKAEVTSAMKSGFSNSKMFPNIKMTTNLVRFSEKTNPGLGVVGTTSVSRKLAQLDPDEVASMIQAGKRFKIYTSMYGTLTYTYVPEPTVARPRLLLVETYKLSSYLGSYGAGKVIKTFSLLPGEKTKISVKTYLKKETDAKSASSILDSFTQESSDDFESSVQNEQSSKDTYEENFEYHAEAEANASWGFGSAKVSGGVKGGTNSSREECAKNVSNATQKHAAKASAKRDVQVNTSDEVKQESGEETSIEREIQNINLSRTLNFVFRQMNQEFITILHFVDARVAFFNGYAESKKEVTLPELDSLLEEVIIDEPKREEVKEAIIAQLQNVIDYKDQKISLIEEKVVAGSDKYWRVRKDIKSIYEDEVTGSKIVVPGVILSSMKSVLRTEGVIVESMLGEGAALDEYAKRLQELEVQRRKAEVEQLTAKAKQATLANQIISDNDKDRAKILVDLTSPLKTDNPSLNVNITSEDKEK